MSKPIVIALGEILWDMLPTGKRAGGAPVNFAYHASQNGAESYAISAVGNDELGAELLNDAHKAGINTLVQTNEYPTGTVAVALTNGIPEYTIVQNVAWDHIGYTDELAEAVSKADAICFGTLGLRSQESHDTIIKLLQHTKEGALKFFDINLRGSVILGYAGVGGLGYAMKVAFEQFPEGYGRGLGIAIVVFVMCVIVEIISSTIRRNLLGIHPAGGSLGGRFGADA